ncbi:MAG: autotransporter-associated beta strand repeat-containing protein [Akkermansiaceae bacterium]|nr:autotransporter-associated beta strand repeat-containing protein [Akkermansiaceae bacterium]
MKSKPKSNKLSSNIPAIGLVLSLAGSHTLQAQTSIQNLNPAAVTQTVTSTTGSATLTVADGTAYSVGDIIRFTDVGNTSPFGGAANYYIVSVSGNDIQVSTTPGGAAVNATETHAAGATQLSQDLSNAATWTGGNVPDTNSEIMLLNSSSGSVPAFIVTQDQTIYGFQYNGSGSDLVLASGADGTDLHTLTFATNNASTPKISFTSTARVVRFGTGNGEALKLGGTQGLIFDGRTGGAITGTGVDAISTNPAKNFRLSEVDWSEFSGGVTLERGEINIQGTAGNLPTNQTLTVGNAQTTTNNTLAHLAMGNFGQTVDGLNGTSLGRISGNSTLSVGNSNGSGDYAGVIGRGMAAGDTNTNLVKNGSGTQIISGIMVGGGNVVVNNGTLAFSGTNTYTGNSTANTGGTLLTTKAAALSGYTTAAKVVFNGGTVGVQVGGSGWTTGEVDTLLTNATKTSGSLGIDTTNGNLTQWKAFTLGDFGALGLSKLGANTLTLDSANTYTGATVISGGTLQLGAGGSTGSLAAGSAITNDGNLAINRDNLVVQGTDFSGAAISGTGSVTQSGSGATRLNISNSYTGGTTLNAGVLSYGANGAFGATSGDLTINGGRIGAGAGNLTIANNVVVGGNFAIGADTALQGSSSGLDISGNVNLGGETREITVRRTAGISGIISNGGLTFIGTSDDAGTANAGRTLTLGGANTYSGATTIQSGTLVLGATGSIDNTSGVSLGTNGTFNVSAKGGYTVSNLSGTGSVIGGLTVSTQLAIGNSPGTMSFTDLTLTGATTTVMEIDGIAGAGVTGGHDQASVSGALTYAGALTLDIGTMFKEGSYSWTLFNITGSETGDFSSVALADQYSGSFVFDSSDIWNYSTATETWSFTQSTGVLDLTVVTVVPEPSAALLCALSLLALLSRRRA